MMLEHRSPVWKLRTPQRIHQSVDFFLIWFCFVATFDLEVFEFAFVGLAQFVDLVTLGILASDRGLDALQIVDVEKVLRG